jgi:pimeloyl-ACP methyl ester carboxylesterase
VKGSKLVVIEQAGHFPWLEQPEAFYAGLEDALAHVGAFTSQISV